MKSCPECHSTNLSWDYYLQGRDGIQNGLHRLSEIVPIVFLGCNECSETIETMPLSMFLQGDQS